MIAVRISARAGDGVTVAVIVFGHCETRLGIT